MIVAFTWLWLRLAGVTMLVPGILAGHDGVLLAGTLGFGAGQLALMTGLVTAARHPWRPVTPPSAVAALTKTIV